MLVKLLDCSFLIILFLVVLKVMPLPRIALNSDTHTYRHRKKMFNKTNRLDQELDLLAVALQQQKEIRLLQKQADKMLKSINSKKIDSNK